MATQPQKLTDEQISESKQVFDLFDKDKSGSISISELERLFKALGANPTKDEMKVIMQEADKNKSGFIDFEEFLGLLATRTRKLTKEEELLEAFKIFDKNNDGFISAQELRDVLTTFGEKLSEEDADIFIKEADVNKDGKLNYNEFVKTLTLE